MQDIQEENSLMCARMRVRERMPKRAKGPPTLIAWEDLLLTNIK